jgi:hypothetical protein
LKKRDAAIGIKLPAQVYVARLGESELTPTILAAQQVRDLVEQMLKLSGRRLDLSNAQTIATNSGILPRRRLVPVTRFGAPTATAAGVA